MNFFWSPLVQLAYKYKTAIRCKLKTFKFTTTHHHPDNVLYTYGHPYTLNRKYCFTAQFMLPPRSIERLLLLLLLLNNRNKTTPDCAGLLSPLTPENADIKRFAVGKDCESAPEARHLAVFGFSSSPVIKVFYDFKWPLAAPHNTILSSPAEATPRDTELLRTLFFVYCGKGERACVCSCSSRSLCPRSIISHHMMIIVVTVRKMLETCVCVCVCSSARGGYHRVMCELSKAVCMILSWLPLLYTDRPENVYSFI